MYGLEDTNTHASEKTSATVWHRFSCLGCFLAFVSYLLFFID